MKIALTSCADPKDAPIQPVWQQIATHHPDHLLLLGDQIYMDYGGFSKNFKLGEPADDSKVSDQRFAAEMHERYEAQWNIMRKSGLFDSANMEIHGIWDDHDFGSNNACGIGVVGDPLFL